MAKLIQAMRKYGPRLERGRTVETEEVIEWMMARSRFLSKGTILAALIEISEAVSHFNRQGIPVRLDGLGIFTPGIDHKGVIKPNYRATARLKKRLNEAGAYRGRIVNKEHIGLDSAGYKELWDADHPDDPLEI